MKRTLICLIAVLLMVPSYLFAAKKIAATIKTSACSCYTDVDYEGKNMEKFIDCAKVFSDGTTKALGEDMVSVSKFSMSNDDDKKCYDECIKPAGTAEKSCKEKCYEAKCYRTIENGTSSVVKKFLKATKKDAGRGILKDVTCQCTVDTKEGIDHYYLECLVSRTGKLFKNTAFDLDYYTNSEQCKNAIAKIYTDLGKTAE